MERLVIVPDEKCEGLALPLQAKLAAVAAEVKAEHLEDLAGELVLRVLAEVPGENEELLLWGISGNAFVAGWTTLEPREEVVEAATASMREGLIARVFASGNSERREAEFLEAAEWTNLQERRGRRLATLTASPVFLFGRCVAVAALADYGGAAEEEGKVAEAAVLAGRLMEDRILRAVLGLESP